MLNTLNNQKQFINQKTKKPYIFSFVFAVFSLLVLFAPIESAKAYDSGSLIAFDHNQYFPFSLMAKKTEVDPGISQVDMNKVNIDHDPEAIKAYMQQIAPEYGVDWKLVYAIGAYESGHYKSNLAKYNNNFFGRKATSTTWMRYDSAEEGIRNQFVYIKERYINKGLDTPAKMNRIYCEGDTWQYKVQYIMDNI
jgi:hypothetical protein